MQITCDSCGACHSFASDGNSRSPIRCGRCGRMVWPGGEGSGLLDIRALAQQTLAARRGEPTDGAVSVSPLQIAPGPLPASLLPAPSRRAPRWAWALLAGCGGGLGVIALLLVALLREPPARPAVTVATIPHIPITRFGTPPPLVETRAAPAASSGEPRIATRRAPAARRRPSPSPTTVTPAGPAQRPVAPAPPPRRDELDQLIEAASSAPRR